MKELRLELNSPFKIAPLKKLFIHPENLPLLRPGAKHPVEESEWIEYFAKEYRYSFLVSLEGKRVGHFGLVKESDIRYRIVFIYLAHELRGSGLAKQILKLSEEYAQGQLKAKELSLNVLDINLKAITLYQRCGFQETSRKDGTIRMEKIIHRKEVQP